MTRRGTMLAWVREVLPSHAPLVPAGWDVVAEAGDIFTVYPLGRLSRPDVFFHARAYWSGTSDALSPPRALFVCLGTPTVLQALADMIASDGLAFTKTWPDLPTFRADATAPATSIRAAWPDERQPPSVGTLVALWRQIAGYLGDDAEGGPVP